ncbi:MAG TPA: hypothetical protein PLY87_01715, partial [Planctomycetaceae bacterium]|nr:hypothetical protein [Planctomycetaceae bacterium]HQZ63756.1 hypothetical protein [Planctomycetaceae bacterium]
SRILLPQADLYEPFRLNHGIHQRQLVCGMGPIAHFIVTPDGGGPHDERAMLEATIEADRLYATD